MADISKITLPSGTTYDIKDSLARSLISAGVTFIVAWDGASAPTASSIPAGVVVKYNNTDTTGTLAANAGVSGAFYLVKSSTTPSSETLDVYDEYVIVKPDVEDNTTWVWEKIGDTKLNLSDVVTEVVLNKHTDTVIGSNATFKITQPTIALATGATAGTGVISVATGITSATASGDQVTAVTGYSSPTKERFLQGITLGAPTVSLTANTATDTGRITYVQSQGTATTTKLSASASGVTTSWNSKDAKTVVTGYANPTKASVLSGITPSTSKLTTTTITGVSGSTTASKATAATSQTTVKGLSNSTNNADLLANVSVSNEVLTIGAKSLSTQTTTQFTFSNVTVPTAASSATTVATGAINANSTGASIVTGVSDVTMQQVLSGLGTASTASVIGASSTLKNTQPTITIANGTTGDVTVATGIGAATTRYLSAAAEAPQVTSVTAKDAITGLGTPTTDKVLGISSTITVTPTTTNIKATATGAKTEWNGKDTVTALTNGTSLTVTKGN